MGKRIELKDRTLSYLKKTLDQEFSRWFRLKHSGPSGHAICYTCGTVKTAFGFDSIQVGHLFSRSRLATRFDQANCRPQCARCNVHNHGAYDVFFPKILREIGEEALAELEAKSRSQVKLTKYWYIQEICRLRAEIKEIEGDAND